MNPRENSHGILFERRKTYMNQEETNLLYGRVGFITALSQMIEYNLAEIQAYVEAISNLEKGQCPAEKRGEILKKANSIYKKGLTQTLGWNISRIKKLGLFDEYPEIINNLETILKERNYVSHQLFKDDVRTQKIQKHLQQVLNRLGNDVGTMNNMNETLISLLQNLIARFSKN
jgi:hypothetical protein